MKFLRLLALSALAACIARAQPTPPTPDTSTLTINGSSQIQQAFIVGSGKYVQFNGGNLVLGYSTTATAAGTTTLTVASNELQYFTGSTTQTVVLPVTTTLFQGLQFVVVNNSSGLVTVQSSGANSILVMAANTWATFTCILTSGTTAASWSAQYNLPTVLSGTANEVAVSNSGIGATTVSLTGPHGFATMAANNIVVGNGTGALAASGATITGSGNVLTLAGGSTDTDNGSGGRTIAAAGSNQNINLSPSGTGAVQLSGVAASVVGLDPFIAEAQAMGASIKAESVGFSGLPLNTNKPLANQVAVFVAVYLANAQTITGVEYYSQATPSYTANNFNGVALYSYSAGTLTRVAISANAAFSATAGTFGQVAFTGTYSAAPGLYYIGVLYCESAQTTAPNFGVTASKIGAGLNTIGTNNSFFSGTIASSTALPTPTQAASGVTQVVDSYWLALY